jgi:hypothetical protein
MVVTARSGERQRFHHHVSHECGVHAREAIEPAQSLEDGPVRLVRIAGLLSSAKTSRRSLKPPIAPTGARDTRTSIESVLLTAASMSLTRFFMAFVPGLFPRSAYFAYADERT